MKSTYVSVLNWNDAASTVKCIESIKMCALPVAMSVSIFVVDNGSRADDVSRMEQGLAGLNVELIKLPQNVGFADGHNLVIRLAMERGIDFIWLVNNDAVVRGDTLTGLLSAIEQNARIAIVSPMIYARDAESKVDFVGAMFDWRGLTSTPAADAKQAASMQESVPSDFVVYGTAPLARVPALCDVGVFRGELFAYFEDFDLCARLACRGWLCQMALATLITHRKSRDVKAERQAYYFYLMTRNAMYFFLTHTPRPHRRLIRVRLLSRAMIQAALLRERGYPEKANATLMGLWDGLRGRLGPPRPEVRAPVWLHLLSRVFPYRMQQWLG